MRFLVISIPVILLAACAGTGSGGSGYSRGSGMSSGDEYNRDVREAVVRGSTQGINPL